MISLNYFPVGPKAGINMHFMSSQRISKNTRDKKWMLGLHYILYCLEAPALDVETR